MELRDQDKTYLSTVLNGTDEESVLAAAVEAARFWGIEPDPDADEVEYARAEAEAHALLAAIREGIADGTITVSIREDVVEAASDDARAQRVIAALRGADGHLDTTE